MSVVYLCRHCQSQIGVLSGDSVNELQLGFHFLTPEERRDIIAYSPNGDVTVSVICDYCREALEAHPELSLQASPLQ